MEGDTVGGDGVLRKVKPKLIEILIGDTDFLLSHVDSLGLLTWEEYMTIKSISNPSQKVRDLLDNVIGKGSAKSYILIGYLQEQAMQETFPNLEFLKTVQIGDTTEKRGTKRPQPMATEEPTPKQTVNTVLSEKQLMLVAGKMGRHWRQFGRVALEIEDVKLQQIVEDNPNNMVEQVFAMLRMWKMRERARATGARLHSLLSDGDWAPPLDNINFLLDGT